MTRGTNGITPYACLNYLFERLPTASTGEQVEALLRWILKAMLDEQGPSVNPRLGSDLRFLKNTAADVGDISSYESGTTLFGYGTTQLNIASYSAVDLNAGYCGLGNWKFALGVVNLFNRQPPYDSGALLFSFFTRRAV
jgi:hypothetical protein